MDEEVRIGVFVCHCGINISSVVDVRKVENSTEGMEGVVYHTDSLYSCSQDAQEVLKEKIKEHKLNRVVIAACSPRTHEPLFQETLKDAGLNRSLIEMVNIRDQCSWVHASEPDAATDKSKDLVRMAVAKARGMKPLPEQTVPVTPRALIIGGGIAGMTAALTLADQGFDSLLLEKGEATGRQSRPAELTPWPMMKQPRYLKDLVGQGQEEQENYRGDRGRTGRHFRLYRQFFLGGCHRDRAKKKEQTYDHGVVILATGGHEHRPDGYLLGKNSKVVTQQELEKQLAGKAKNRAPNSVVMIQCAGSRGDDLNYCSKVCCNHAVKNALKIKEINPDSQVIVLYRDMRTYGYAEDAYREARLKGVVFIPYELDNKPEVYEKGRNAAGEVF